MQTQKPRHITGEDPDSEQHKKWQRTIKLCGSHISP